MVTPGSLLRWLNAIHKEPQNQWWEGGPAVAPQTSQPWQWPWPDSGHNGRKFLCELCEFKATLKKDLTQHIQSKHEVVSYYCDQYKYIILQRDDLYRHICCQHEGLRHYCNKCEYNSSDPSNLLQHVISKEWVMTVNLCEYIGRWKNALNYHIRSKHYGVIPSSLACTFFKIKKCIFCGKNTFLSPRYPEEF